MIETSGEQEGVTIRHKLASIIIPNIEFHSTTLGDAIEYLRQEARRLDTDPDADARGVNIFLKLPAAAARPAAPAPDANIPGLPSGVDTGSGVAAGMLCPPGFPLPTRITLIMSHIPLLEALKYVASQAGLKVKVEPYAVSLVPLAEDTETLVTAVFRVPPNLIGNVSSRMGKSALDQPATPAQ